VLKAMSHVELEELFFIDDWVQSGGM